MAAHDHLNGDNSISHIPKKPKLSSFITQSELESEFSHHDPAVARINNGSFGSCPASVIAAQQQWQLKFLRQPDHFYFNDLKKGILRSRTIIKEIVNADHVDEISIVDNATTAAAIVLQQIAWAFQEGKFQKGDVAVMLHYAYGAVKKSMEAYVTRAGCRVIEVQLPFPVSSNDEIISEFRRALERGKDAAHSLGFTDVDMKEIGADFYTSNLHKWFFCPPSIAFLYTRKSPRCSELHHPVVSHEYGNGLADESAWIGTRDYSAQLVVPAALEFVNRFEGGIEGIKRRNHDAVVEMGWMLATAWGTHLGSPPDMCGSMIMVGLPACLGIMTESDTLKLRTLLRDDFGVEVPIYYRPPKDGEIGSLTGYARISYQVYNKVDDYYKFRDAINQLVRKEFTCALLSN
ncbi:putative L-cysteine desulfhydrase, chloroplastic [Senna tora]|uniref:Putative L-cysteine desulfhydrase, chloroplastic n=1 Tax=Senna tora TaxID=362788 RepID=A0A834SQ15_9FABA|nr:putative L-cysteine desulfhydrase, chloroplastic [Senna tora]